MSDGAPEVSASYEPAEHYDRVTAAWTLLLGDDLHYGVFRGASDDLAMATGNLTGRMVDAARIERGCDVLDVGCGTGAPACLLARTLGARVVGITTSAEGVRAARARANAGGLSDRVTFERRDGMDNGFEPQRFDRVWVLESSHLMRDRAALVSECARVLRPGGRLTLCDIVLKRPMGLKDVKRLRQPLALLREVFGDARMEPLAEYARLAADHGIEVDTQDDLTAASRPTFEAWRANAARHGDELARLLGPRQLRDFVAACDVLERFWDDGTLGYGLLAGQRS